MDNPTDKLKPMGVQSKETVALAAAKARDALDSAAKTADRAIDKVADEVDDAKADASATIDQAAGAARKVAATARERFGNVSHLARAQVSSYSDRVADYTHNEPIKAMLIAAAAGALLMGLMSLLVRSDD